MEPHPTFNSTIEPHPVPSKAEIISEIQPIYTPPPLEREFEFSPEPIKPPASSSPPPCCALPSAPVTHDTDPLALFNALGAALGVGVAIGGLLVYAFSRPTVVEVLE